MMKLWVFNGSGTKKVVELSFSSGNVSAKFFDDAARYEIEPLLNEPIEHEIGEPVFKGSVMVGVATAWGKSYPGTEEHFIALNSELLRRGYWSGIEDGVEEQAATG